MPLVAGSNKKAEHSLFIEQNDAHSIVVLINIGSFKIQFCSFGIWSNYLDLTLATKLAKITLSGMAEHRFSIVCN